MQTINLNNLQGIPNEFREELKSLDQLFKKHVFLENILCNVSISDLISRLDEYCLTKRIFGFHYARANTEKISLTGLICRNGDTIRNEFLEEYGTDFKEDELLKIKMAWVDYFGSEQRKSRDNRLYFNFTANALENGNAKPLLTNYGGEQVYMPLKKFTDIGDKIRAIGIPLVLKCSLNPNNVTTFYEKPWGRIAMSKYHCQINPRAFQDDQDGYQTIDVKPEDIEIIEYDSKTP